MKFIVLTLFKEMFSSLNESILKRAKEDNKIDIDIIDIRDFANNKHNRVDKTPYGGGAGMVLMPEPINDAYFSISEDVRKKAKVIYLSPQGNVLTQQKVEELSKEENLILLCGHYEGVDQRILDKIIDEEISIGDYVLTGGEIPACVLIDSVSRYVNGVIKEESLKDESHTNGLLEYSQYTRPENFEGNLVPEVLLSGNHKKIDEYRRYSQLKNTYIKRPDLIEKLKKENKLTKVDLDTLEKIKSEINEK